MQCCAVLCSALVCVWRTHLALLSPRIGTSSPTVQFTKQTVPLADNFTEGLDPDNFKLLLDKGCCANCECA